MISDPSLSHTLPHVVPTCHHFLSAFFSYAILGIFLDLGMTFFVVTFFVTACHFFVTAGHGLSRLVTACHGLSRLVTLLSCCCHLCVTCLSLCSHFVATLLSLFCHCIVTLLCTFGLQALESLLFQEAVKKKKKEEKKKEEEKKIEEV